MPALTLGTPLNDSFTAADQDQYYQVTVPAGGSLVVAVTSAASSGALRCTSARERCPRPYNYQEAAVVANQPNQSVTVPQVLTAGTYYILAHSVSGAAATAAYTLTVTQSSAPTVSAISPASGGNAGNVTVEIDGTNFTPTATATLTLGGTTINATAIDFVSAEPDVRHLRPGWGGRRQLHPECAAGQPVGDGADFIPGGGRHSRSR